MKTPYDFRIILNEEEKKNQEFVIELLKKLVKSYPCGTINYLVVNGDDMGSDYQLKIRDKFKESLINYMNLVIEKITS